MLSRDLRDAIETLLAGPYSEDQHGYAHYINVSLFDTLRTAYLAELKTATRRPRRSATVPPQS